MLVRDGTAAAQYVLPAITLPAHGFVSFTDVQLGFTASNGDRLFLYTADKRNLIDARQVTTACKVDRSNTRGDGCTRPRQASERSIRSR